DSRAYRSDGAGAAEFPAHPARHRRSAPTHATDRGADGGGRSGRRTAGVGVEAQLKSRGRSRPFFHLSPLAGRGRRALAPRVRGGGRRAGGGGGGGRLSTSCARGDSPSPQPSPRKRGEGASLLRRFRRLGQRRIVRISLGAAAIEGRLVPFIERRAALQPLDQ